jgi:ATP synthase protein I
MVGRILMKAERRLQPIVLLLLAQTAIALVVAAGLALWQGRLAAISALLGGAIAVIPNAFLAARLLHPKARSSAKALLRAAWLGEIGKLVLTALLFAIVLVTMRPISALGLFGGFIATQLVIFGAPLLGGAWLDDEDG